MPPGRLRSCPGPRELNGRCQTAPALDRPRPRGAKAPRRITHDLRLRDAADPLTYFCDTAKALKKKLGAMLFQLPPFLKKDVARLEDFLHQLPPGFRPAFEFRHQTWFADDVFECLRRFDVALCIAEHEERSAPF